MSAAKYVISYRTVPDIERATRRTMEAYIDQEEAAWSPFLRRLSEQAQRVQIRHYQRSLTGSELATPFGHLREALDDPRTFAAVSARSRRQLPPPPPSNTIEGQLVLGLHSAGRLDDALAVHIWFVATELGEFVQFPASADQTAALYKRGDLLLAAAHVSAALPYQKLTASGLRSAQASAARQNAMLDEAVGNAERVNAGHEAALAGFRKRFAAQAGRLRGLLVRTERERDRRFRNWRDAVDAEVERRFADAEGRIEALDRLAQRQQRDRQQSFEDLKSLFHAQLRLRAPVALWEQRAEGHRRRSGSAQRNFWIAAACAVAVGILVPALLGDYIAGSFSTLQCLPGSPDSCVRQFSAKGPLTVAGLLLTVSLILWATRLQYRIFLSERHLSLDADERKAFAETFMALKEDASVDIANETIVLASLFRPTQDGIIKDEDGGIDLSAAALLARQMAR